MTTPLNRRDVLKLGGGVLAMAALGRSAGGAEGDAKPDAPKPDAPRPKRALKKAVMWDMIGAGKTVLEKFEALKEAGFDGVEMNSPSNIPVDEVKAACATTGMLVEGVVDSVHWQQTLSHNSPEMRAAGLKGLETALRDCKAMGGTSVLLVPGVVDKSVSYDDCWKRSQEQIRKAVPLARELGVKIAIENVWNHFIMSPLEAARYVDEFEAPDVVGWHFDIGNVIVYGWPAQWVRILGKRIVKLHIKEFSRAKANNEGLWKGFNVELTDGEDNDWPAVVKALDDIGYNTWACAEVGGGDLKRLKFVSERMDRILAM
jgi:L-ribulose-5-phosphate 3-epimerase